MVFIQSLALVAFGAVQVEAFWRLPCASPVVVERADPIVNPGTVSGHVHTVMGGNAFDFTMDYATTQKSDCTSCQVHGDLSNYWIPTLYYKHQNGTFEQVKQNGGMLAYYLQRKGQDNEKLHAFPEGFRMVAGDPYKRSGGDDFASQAISYNCLDYSGKSHHEETGMFPNYNCPNGLRSQVFFPACWDGKNLDSDDHKSHVSYPKNIYNNGACPESHPVHLISLFYEIIWETDKFADMWYGNTQPFVWSMGDSTGYGLHGDFLNGWDVDLLQRAVDGCTNDSGRVEDCQVFDLYSSQEAGQCKKQSTLNEGLNYLEALPGCNAVSNGPEAASKAANCANVPDVGTGGGGSNGGDGNDGGSSSTPVYGDSPSASTSKAAASTTAYANPPSSMTTLVKSTTKAPSTSTKSKSHGGGGHHHSSKVSSYNQAPGTPQPGSFYPTSSEPATSAQSTSSTTATTSAEPTTAATYEAEPSTTDASPSESSETPSYAAPSPSSTPKGKGSSNCKRNAQTIHANVIEEANTLKPRVNARHIAGHRVHARSGRMGPSYH